MDGVKLDALELFAEDAKSSAKRRPSSAPF